MAEVLATLDAIPDELVPAAIARLSARLLARPAEPDDLLLTVPEAAALLRVNKRFIYRNARQLGASRISGRQLRLSRQAVLRFVKNRRDSRT